MTTMFVQLRHVVYLLVLLECCVCMVRATDDANQGKAGGVDAVTGEEVFIDREEALRRLSKIPNYDYDDIKNDGSLSDLYSEFWMAVWKVQLALKDANARFANGTTCISQWGDVIKANNKMVEDAEGATEKITNLTRDIGDVVTKKEGGKTVRLPAGNVDKSKFDGLVQEAIKVLEETKEKVPKEDAMKKLDEAEQARLMCTGIRREVDYTLESLKKGLEYYDNFGVNYSANKKAMEVKKVGEDVRDVLQNITHLLGKVTVQGRFSVGEAKKRIEAWRKAYADLELVGGMEEATEKKEELQKIKDKIEVPKKDLGYITDKTNATTAKRGNKTIKDVDKRIKDANADELQRMEVEKKRIAEDDRRRVEQERLEREMEERRRQEEERQGKAEAAAAEARRVKDEQERKKREEQAKKERDEQAKEEKAKRVAEEKARQVAEEAKKKKKDGSSSPELVHGPFLLIVLMCVLGSTAVC
ncbi:uncharacterized protein TM35_000063060 [Trypanosoma theileri]|uniref:Uncharacterized protein n=1 Tax=Trypanosoma theileri TaxID=67003 RepID=A0A1X0P368_9TRYP|nr:uncharacterized protein TM35_000063060 [Trypanosoma theileri]ORC91301.1 hypothetical protein TM35_000063060 [Trypanosoma theileri]